jgi:peptidoglycan hydrolase-like protein with peptidoglycan-binding domain
MPSTQPGAGQAGAGTTGSKPMATDGQADADQVKSLQKALQEKGMDPGPIDGIMGPRTQSALRAYQKDQKLPETGRLDAQTREKLGVN